MKQIWSVCRSTYLDWLLRPQMLVMIPVLLFYYIKMIEPMCYYADVLGTPLGVLEPYLCLLNSVAAVPVLPMVFLFLLAGYPKLNPFSVFQLTRIGKEKWYCGQCLFVLLAALTLLAFFLLFSLLMVCDRAFVANGWSIAVRQIYSADHLALAQQSGYARIDLSVLNQIRPYHAFLTCTALQLLYLLIAGTLDLAWTVAGKKMVGVLCNSIGIGLGLLLLMLDTPLKWLLPASHSVFAWHYDSVLNRTYFPVSGSYAYDAVVLVVLLRIGWLIIRRCSPFSIMRPE